MTDLNNIEKNVQNENGKEIAVDNNTKTEKIVNNLSNIKHSDRQEEQKMTHNIQNNKINPLFDEQHGGNKLFGNIRTTQNPHIINIDQQTVYRDTLIVETLHNQKKFMFYDRNKNFLGGFSVFEFVKYVTSHVSNNFLLGVECDSIKPVIEKYICKITDSQDGKRVLINMHNYFESPFMGNIETLIKLYTFVHEFENNYLLDELSKLDQSEKKTVLSIFNIMVYTLLNHILKIIAILVNKIDVNDINSSKIKNSLLNYSVVIVYRLSKFIREEITMKSEELETLHADLSRMDSVRLTVLTKLDNMQKVIEKQNIEIDMILRQILVSQSQLPKKHTTEKQPSTEVYMSEIHTDKIRETDILDELQLLRESVDKTLRDDKPDNTFSLIDIIDKTDNDNSFGIENTDRNNPIYGLSSPQFRNSQSMSSTMQVFNID